MPPNIPYMIANKINELQREERAKETMAMTLPVMQVTRHPYFVIRTLPNGPMAIWTPQRRDPIQATSLFPSSKCLMSLGKKTPKE